MRAIAPGDEVPKTAGFGLFAFALAIGGIAAALIHSGGRRGVIPGAPGEHLQWLARTRLDEVDYEEEWLVNILDDFEEAMQVNIEMDARIYKFDSVTFDFEKTSARAMLQMMGDTLLFEWIVRGDTLTSAEQAFVRALGSKLAEYRDIMTSYALELKGANSISSSPVQVTSGMRREFLRRLRERGIDVSPDLWAGARRFVDRQFAYEVERYVFGRETETRRRIHDDMQVQKAIELLRQVQTPSELLALVERDTELIRNP